METMTDEDLSEDESWDNIREMNPKRKSHQSTGKIQLKYRYQCKVCSKRYNKLHFYKEHLRTHTTKPTVHKCCSLCPGKKKFTKLGLRRHMIKFHGEQTIKQERTVNNNVLPAIDNYAIFKDLPPREKRDFAKIVPAPPSPSSDECSNCSTSSRGSLTNDSSGSNTPEASSCPDSLQTSDSDTNVVIDFYEEMRDVDDEIMRVLVSEFEKTFVEVQVLSFNEF